MRLYMSRYAGFLLLSMATAVGHLPALAQSHRQVSAPPVGPAFGSQAPTGIAFDGDQGFVIWNDTRSASGVMVYGSRIDIDGKLLDPSGIRLTANGGWGHGAITVLWGGDAWIAIYHEAGRISGRRIDRSGRFLGSAVTLMNRGAGHVSAATNGATLFVAYAGTQDHYAIVANRDLTGVRVVDMTLLRGFDVVADGGDYVVFGYLPYLYGGRTVQAARFTSGGDVAGQKDTGVPEPFAAATRSGETYFIATQKRRANAAEAPDGVQVWRLTRDLEVSGEPLILTTARAMTISLTPDHRGGALAVWSEDDSAEFRLRTYGVHIGLDAGTAVRLGDRRWFPGQIVPKVFAFDGEDFVGAISEVTIVKMPPERLEEGVIDRVQEQTISPAAQLRFMPDRSSASGVYVFAEQDGATSRVMIGRHDETARVLHPSAEPQYAPSIASSGRTALVTWIEQPSPIRAAKVMAMMLDETMRPFRQPVVLGETWHLTDYWTYDQRTWPAGVIWTGSIYFIAWGGWTAHAYEDGSIVGITPTPIGDHVSLARLGDMIVAVSMTYGSLRPCMLECVYSDVVAQRFTVGGAPIEAEPFRLSYGGLPQIAVNGDTAAVVTDSGGTILMKSNGTIAGPLFHDRTFMIRPSIASSGGGFVVAWQDTYYATGTIHVATMSSDGSLGIPFAIATDAPPHTPQTWTTPDGKAAVTYLRVNAQTDWVPRLFTTIIDEEAPRRRRSVRR